MAGAVWREGRLAVWRRPLARSCVAGCAVPFRSQACRVTFAEGLRARLRSGCRPDAGRGPRQAGRTASSGPQARPGGALPAARLPRAVRVRSFGHAPTVTCVPRGAGSLGTWNGSGGPCDGEPRDNQGVAKSFYKAAWIGKLPMCAICGGPGEGPRAEHHLTHGVSVWLCAAHRSDEFQRRRAGRDFVASLQAVWRAAGIRSRRHSAALTTHLRRIRPPRERDRPGSYAWPDLRRDAEERWAAGEPPGSVIAELRGRHENNPFRAPSVRTMRRWFTQARWLHPGRDRRGSGAAPAARPIRPTPRRDARALGGTRPAQGHPTPKRPAPP